MFKLRESQPIAQGHKRFVFQHPADSSLLIKVWQPEVVEKRWGRRAAWHKRTRYAQYVSLHREISEQLALAIKFPNGVPVLQGLFGTVPTDYGIGLVVEKLMGRNGGLAPTLFDLARTEGVTARIVEKLERFRNELLHYGVIVGKLHDRNLVLASRSNEEQFVMVDGYGEKTAIPIHVWSARLNAAHTRRKVNVLIRKLQSQFERRS